MNWDEFDMLSRNGAFGLSCALSGMGFSSLEDVDRFFNSLQAGAPDDVSCISFLSLRHRDDHRVYVCGQDLYATGAPRFEDCLLLGCNGWTVLTFVPIDDAPRIVVTRGMSWSIRLERDLHDNLRSLWGSKGKGYDDELE